MGWPSLRKIHPPQEVLKAGVIAQGIEPWIARRLSHHLYTGLPSRTLIANEVGVTVLSRKSACSNRNLYSSSVRSIPPGNTSIAISLSLAKDGSFAAVGYNIYLGSQILDSQSQEGTAFSFPAHATDMRSSALRRKSGANLPLFPPCCRG